MLQEQTREFWSALQLFDLCRSRRIPIAKDGSNFSEIGPNNKYWSGLSLIPAKYGVFILYNFHTGLIKVGDATRAYREVSERADWDMYAFAREQFKEGFPGLKELRGAFGHVGKDDAEKHALRGPYVGPEVILGEGSDIFLANSVRGRAIGTSVNGKMPSCEITEASLQRLLLIAGAVFEALGGKDETMTFEKRALSSAEKLRAEIE